MKASITTRQRRCGGRWNCRWRPGERNRRRVRRASPRAKAGTAGSRGSEGAGRMRALVCEAYGPIESLRIADLPVPEPRPDEILIRVGAAGVSFAAMLGVQGKHQNKPALPYVPG